MGEAVGLSNDPRWLKTGMMGYQVVKEFRRNV